MHSALVPKALKVNRQNNTLCAAKTGSLGAVCLPVCAQCCANCSSSWRTCRKEDSSTHLRWQAQFVLSQLLLSPCT